MNYSKIKNICSAKDSIKKGKWQATEWDVSQWIDLTDDLGPECIKNDYKSVCKRQLNRKMNKKSEQKFYKKDIQMANKQMKKYSIPLVNREYKLNLQWDNSSHPPGW